MNRPRTAPLDATLLAAVVAAPAAAQREALDLLPPDAEVAAVELPNPIGAFAPTELPGKGALRGLARGGGFLWLVRGDEWLAMRLADREVRRQQAAPAGLLGLTADERFLYVLRAQDVAVFDPRALQEVRSLPLPAPGDVAPRAIGAHGDELFVAWPERLVAIDKRTGAARAVGRPRDLQWLASDGDALWGGGRGWFGRLDVGAEVRTEARGLPRLADRNLGAFVGGRLLLAECNDRGARRPALRAGFVVPGDALPLERLLLKLHRRGDGVVFEVGPKPLAEPAQLAAELKRIAQDPSSMVPGRDGRRELMPIVIEAYPGVRVRELAAAWDLATAAGFDRVRCASPGSRLPVAEPAPPRGGKR